MFSGWITMGIALWSESEGREFKNMFTGSIFWVYWSVGIRPILNFLKGPVADEAIFNNKRSISGGGVISKVLVSGME